MRACKIICMTLNKMFNINYNHAGLFLERQTLLNVSPSFPTYLHHLPFTQNQNQRQLYLKDPKNALL